MVLKPSLADNKTIGVIRELLSGSNYSNPSGELVQSGNYAVTIDYGYYMTSNASLADNLTDKRLTMQIDNRYINTGSLGTQSVYYEGNYDGTNSNYRMVGVGTIQGAPLLFRGFLDGGYDYFVTSNGLFEKIQYDESGWSEGLTGGTTTLWSGSPSVTGMGRFYNPNNRQISWGDITGTTSDNGSYYLAQDGITYVTTGGAFKYKGIGMGLYIRGEGPTYEAGLITSGTEVFNMYNNFDMWETDGTMTASAKGTTTYSPTDVVTGNAFEYNYYDEIAGKYKEGISGKVGLIGGSTSPGAAEGHTIHIKDQDWGIFWGRFGGTYVNAPSSAWQTKYGFLVYGYKTAPDPGQFVDGYGLAEINSPSGWSTEGYFSAPISGATMTRRHYATMTGNILGVYGSSNYSGIFIGSYQEKNLQYVSMVASPMQYFNPPTGGIGALAGLVIDDGLINDGSFDGLFGHTSSFWNANKDNPEYVTFVGRFLSGVANNHVFLTETASHDFDKATHTTYDGGAYKGYFLGTETAQIFNSKFLGLYVDVNKNAGYLIANLTGKGCPTVETMRMDGNIYPVQFASATGLDPANLLSSIQYKVHSGYAHGQFGVETSINFPNVFGISSMNINNQQDWGIWAGKTGGTYTGTTSDTWMASVDMGASKQIYQMEIMGNKWSNNAISGKIGGYGASLESGKSWISLGETLGTFDPSSLVFQAVNIGPWIETNKLIELAATDAGREQLKQLDIPCIQVGMVDLKGSWGSGTNSIDMTGVNGMNNVKFFSTSVGGKPQIWATGNVLGGYTGNPIGASVPLSGGGLEAKFNITGWDKTTNNKWMATVTNGTGTLNGGSYTGSVAFNGAAAGSIGTTTFSGTAAGTAK
jgi:hypothetical protein